MRLSLSSLLLFATLACLPAQDPGQRPPRPGAERGDFGPEGGPPPPPPNPIFLALDLDNDGEISSKEIAKAATSLAKLDRNKDGMISEDEVRPPRPGRRGPGGFGGPGGPGGPPVGEFEGPPGVGPRGGPGGPRGADSKTLVDSVMKLDRNGDGKISAEELPERMARMMTEGDTNKDGFLERSEVEALSRRQGTQGNRRPGPPGGGPPGAGPGGAPDNF